MGAKMTADEAALAPILEEIAARGLLFLDDGSSSRSRRPSGPPIRRREAQTVLDASAEAIDRELQRLEAIARERGTAIGSASALRPRSSGSPLAQDPRREGVQLVPVSALAEARPMTGSAARLHGRFPIAPASGSC